MKFPLKHHVNLPRNQKGEDWFTGDVHGEWRALVDLMLLRGFDFDADRLFMVGDLIDRGSDSPGTLLFLDQSDFAYSIAGNHELMFFESLYSAEDREMHLCNGGEWTLAEDEIYLDQLRGIIAEQMPLSMSIETEYGIVGMVHASAPHEWELLRDPESDYDRCYRYLVSRSDCREAALGNSRAINGVDLVIHGHTQTEDVVVGRNQIWIDTAYSEIGRKLITLSEAVSYIQRS
ncbi:serine/threonine protein phosphatase 1 [Marinobacter sp. es.048]|uniref:metallophosphoesterase n=1 Tax=Marinobacter sp. es.048 TaxID=1761795 RepID=UPI000B6812BD|nr:metallophosphoesterase [Marinobacter sp. es.048]SNC59375.1 serine/threonine protein phosphatase 1 [Marinobacter sp. es.048]